jgi:hypothetical protein
MQNEGRIVRFPKYDEKDDGEVPEEIIKSI